MGCKRILIADDYYPTLCQPHVQLETTAIAEVESHGVRLVDGRRIGLDTLITATGFEAADVKPPCPGDRPAGPHAARHLGAGRAGLPRHDGGGVSEPVHHRRPQHRARATTRWCSSSSRSLRSSTTAMRELKFHAWLEPHRRRSAALQRRAQAALAAHRVGHAAAAAGTGAPTAASPRCGPAPRSNTGAARGVCRSATSSLRWRSSPSVCKHGSLRLRPLQDRHRAEQLAHRRADARRAHVRAAAARMRPARARPRA